MYILRAQGFLVYYKTSLGVLKVVTSNIYFRQQYDFPLKTIIIWLILILLIQRNTHCQSIEIKESPEYIFYDNIGDFSIRSFRYHSNDTKRNSRVSLCSHCTTNDSPAISTYLITKNQKVYISSHDGLQNFITPTFLNISPMVSQGEDRVAGISFFLH